MITGFEKYTHDITVKEREIIPHVCSIILRSNSNFITNNEICERLSDMNLKTTQPRIRKMIHLLHSGGHLKNLVATSDGYKLASSEVELENYIDSLKGRIEAIKIRLRSSQRDLINWSN